MSAPRPLFDSFDEPSLAQSRGSVREATRNAEVEAERLAAYESGYKSGWDDCLAAEIEGTKRVGAELARNLSDLGFTYHEARTQLLSDLEAFLAAFFRSVLPSIAGTAVAARITDDLVELASGGIDRRVEIVVPPSEMDVLRDLMPAAPAMEVDLVEEPALANGQAYLRFGSIERKYDLSGLTERLIAAVANRREHLEKGVGDAEQR